MKTLIKTLAISSLAAVALNSFAIGSSEPSNPYVMPVFEADQHGEHGVPGAVELPVTEAKGDSKDSELNAGGRKVCSPPEDCSSRWIIR